MVGVAFNAAKQWVYFYCCRQTTRCLLTRWHLFAWLSHHIQMVRMQQQLTMMRMISCLAANIVLRSVEGVSCLVSSCRVWRKVVARRSRLTRSVWCGWCTAASFRPRLTCLVSESLSYFVPRHYSWVDSSTTAIYIVWLGWPSCWPASWLSRSIIDWLAFDKTGSLATGYDELHHILKKQPTWFVIITCANVDWFLVTTEVMGEPLASFQRWCWVGIALQCCHAGHLSKGRLGWSLAVESTVVEAKILKQQQFCWKAYWILIFWLR